MRSPDRYTSSDSTESGSSREEERGRSAQEFHGSAVTRQAVEITPPAPLTAPSDRRPVPVPKFEGTLLIPHDDLEKPLKPTVEEDEEDSDEDEESPRPSASHPQPKLKSEPATDHDQTVAPPTERIEWPAEELELSDMPPENAVQTEATQHTSEMPDIAHLPEQPMRHEYQGRQPEDYVAAPGHTHAAPLPPADYVKGNSNASQEPDTSTASPFPARPTATGSAHGFAAPPHAGGLPPVPPLDRPPHGPDAGYPGPDGLPPLYNGYNMPPQPPAHYERPPVGSGSARHNTSPTYIEGSDPLARLGVIGNFIGNRRTRKKLGRKIAANQKETNANFADMQAQQMRLEQQQRSQGRELYNMRQQTHNPVERAATAATVATAASYGERGPAPLTGAHSESLPNTGRTPNTQPDAAQERLVPLPPLPEQRPMPPAEAAEPVELHPDERVESSAWHNIVVKNGREVANAIHYGEGFQKERQQEVIHDRTAGNQAAKSLGGMAVGGPMGGHAGSSMHYGLPSGMTAPGLHPGVSAHDPQQQSADAKKDSAVPGPVFWVMLIVIMVAFFAAALI